MELLNYIGFWKQYASDVSACMAWDWFAISTLEACQTDRLESKMLLSVCIYQHQNWLTCSLRGIQSAWLNRVLQNEAPSGTVLLHLVHGICVLSVWVCLRVCWNLHLTQLCIHMWSVFLSQVPDTLFPCTTVRTRLLMQQRQCLSLLFILVQRLWNYTSRKCFRAQCIKTWAVIIWLIINAPLPKNKVVNNSLWFSTNSISDFISWQCSQ